MPTTAAALPTYYRPSGRVAWHAPLKVLLIGGLGAAVLAAVYTLVIRYNPLIYFSCLGTMIFGLLLGAVAAAACAAGQSRSRAFNAVAGLAIGLIALWLHWLMWTWLMFDDGGQTVRHLATGGPSTWSDFFSYTAEHRHLTVGRLGHEGSEESPGFMTTTWIAEAAAVLLMSASIGMLGARKPFSERSMTWAKTDWSGEFHVAPDTPLDARDVEARIVRQGLDWLVALHAGGPILDDKAPGVRLQVTCESAPGDPACAYVSIAKVTQRGEKGKVNATLVKNLHVDAAGYARLLAALKTPTATEAAMQTTLRGPGAWK